jgi:hypothetical protein
LGVPVDKADEYLIQKIDELIVKCVEISTPCAGFTIHSGVQFIGDAGMMMLGGISFNINRIVASSLEKSTEMAVFIGTCGNDVEEYSKQLMKEGHTLEGYIVDLIGSEIAEGVADFVHKQIESELAFSGMKVTNRYSPGYCNWPVSEQQKLFSLLGNNICGVHLTETSLMIPIKSVSGIIGVGTEVENKGYTCDICDSAQCIYREKKMYR